MSNNAKLGSTLLEYVSSRLMPGPPSSCQLWIGGCSAAGYGYLDYGGKRLSVHRVAWELFRGPIPPGMNVCHHCDVPLCGNPDHLFLGTHSDNQQDSKRKMRNTRGRAWPHPQSTEARIKISRALKGKPFSPEHRAKCIQAKIGIPLSVEHRYKLSLAQKGKKKTLVHAANIRRGLKGYKRTHEHQEKLNQALKNRGPISLEHRNKISEALKGRTLTMEHRARLSVVAFRRSGGAADA